MKQISFTGREFNELQRPCIYAWFQHDRCFYVGQSENGVVRPFSPGHHIINGCALVEPNDTILIFFVELALDTSLDLWELYYINKFKPLFNKNKPNYEIKDPQGMRLLQKDLRDQEELAKVLQCEMSELTLLGNSRSCENLSTEERRERLEQIIKVRKLLSKVDDKHFSEKAYEAVFKMNKS